jgi:hypothetical protein
LATKKPATATTSTPETDEDTKIAVVSETAVEETVETAEEAVPAHVTMSAMDLMAPAEGPVVTDPSDAGKGMEDVDDDVVILPRLQLLQAMSKVITEDALPGAIPGVWFARPMNRPATLSPDDGLKFVVAKVFPAWRRWGDLDSGDGILCEASDGSLTARQPNGLTGAKIDLDVNKKGEITSVDWIEGTPTDSCMKCVFGPAAAAAAAGKPPGRKSNPWLPKVVKHGDDSLKLPDKMRAPKCTKSLDVLALILLPEWKDENTGTMLPAELIPAFMSFGRSSFSAGRTLASTLKMSRGEPTWAKIWSLGSKSVTNDKGTFYVATTTMAAYANPHLRARARELFEATSSEAYRPDMSDVDDLSGGDTVSGGSVDTSISDDEAAPDDQF